MVATSTQLRKGPTPNAGYTGRARGRGGNTEWLATQGMPRPYPGLNPRPGRLPLAHAMHANNRGGGVHGVGPWTHALDEGMHCNHDNTLQLAFCPP